MKNILGPLVVLIAGNPCMGAEPKAEPKDGGLKLATVRNLLGKPWEDKEVKAVVKTLTGQPKVSSYNDSSYQVYYDAGIDFRLDMKGKVTTIFLFAEGSDKHKAYKGELPAGLTFANTRGEVEKKLGKPDSEFGGCGVLQYQESYNKQGFDVRYFSKDKSDQKAKVAIVTLFPPRNK
jgi:hypothetical protein